MENPAVLQQHLNQLQDQLNVLQTQIQDVRAKIALYRTARAARPPQVSATWEPILDDSGLCIGWMDPTSEAYKHV